MNNHKELTSLTNQLLNYINKMSERYTKARESGLAGDFFQEVKPFADEVKVINEQWKKEAIEWIEQNRPKNLFSQQIESTHEHIETMSVQAFFPDTSRSRFFNLISSSNYVLNQILQLL